jgi:hypothetical protein
MKVCFTIRNAAVSDRLIILTDGIDFGAEVVPGGGDPFWYANHYPGRTAKDPKMRPLESQTAMDIDAESEHPPSEFATVVTESERKSRDIKLDYYAFGIDPLKHGLQRPVIMPRKFPEQNLTVGVLALV